MICVGAIAILTYHILRGLNSPVMCMILWRPFTIIRVDEHISESRRSQLRDTCFVSTGNVPDHFCIVRLSFHVQHNLQFITRSISSPTSDKIGLWKKITLWKSGNISIHNIIHDDGSYNIKKHLVEQLCMCLTSNLSPVPWTEWGSLLVSTRVQRWTMQLAVLSLSQWG